MALLLSLETSSKVCSVALHQGQQLLAVAEVHQDQVHAARLTSLVDHVTTTTGVGLRDVSAVAVSSGPGSYTGLRIGTSTAKGLCYALDIPLISVSSLEVMAHSVHSVGFNGALLCPMIDARRMEVYCCLIAQHGNLISPVEAKIIDDCSFGPELEDNTILFFGDGSDKCEQVIKHRHAHFVKDVYASAAHLGKIAAHKYERNLFEDVMMFEPFYLKEFKAKLPSNIITGTLNKS